jgi:hypothetical protein
MLGLSDDRKHLFGRCFFVFLTQERERGGGMYVKFIASMSSFWLFERLLARFFIN